MSEMQNKKVIFSGIQPSGNLNIGTYIGALRNWVKLQEDYTCYYCIVDLHAITVRQEPAELRKRCLSFLAQYIACGLDPEKNVLFFQSHVPAHAELSWLLTCNSYMGELGRMTQYKEKSERAGDNIGAGLFNYPVLMAADILLYQTDLVPVGADQKQHLELCRDIAIRFNNAYGETFRVPEPYIPKQGGRIMSLTEPTKKMSKSADNVNSYIAILDEPSVILRKFARAVTDSGSEIKYSPDKPGVSNLLDIYAACTGKSISDIEAELEGAGYGKLKSTVGEAVVELLRPIQEQYTRLMGDKAYLEQIFTAGAQKASYAAAKTLAKTQKKIGLAPKKL